MNHEWVPLINLGAICAIAVFLIVRSRSWTLPVQAARIDVLENDQAILRGNVSRIERDVHEWHRTHLETNRAILRELEAIKTNGAKEKTLDSDVREIEDRMVDLEQMISSLPCAEHLDMFAKVPIPPKKPEEE